MAITAVPCQLRNRAAFARTDVITHGVGLLPGEIPAAGTPVLRVTGAQAAPTKVQWRNIGRRWSDGSYKHIEVCYLADMTADERKQCTISEAATAGTAFALSANVSAGLAGTTIAFQVNGTTVSRTLAQVISLGTLLKGAEADALVRRYRLRGRLEAVATTQLYAVMWEVTCDFYSGLDHVEIWVKYGYSYANVAAIAAGNPWNNTVLIVTTAATIVVTGPGAYMRREAQRFHAVGRVGAVTTFTIHDPAATGQFRQVWDMGKVYRRRGVLIFGSLAAPTAEAEKLSDARGIAMDWPDKSWPIFGTVAEYPPYVDDRDDAIVRLETFEDTFEAAGATAEPLGTSGMFNPPPTTSITGGSFPPTCAQLALQAGYPALLDIAESEVYQDSLRKNEYYNEDVTPWNPLEHPGCQIWNGSVNGPNSNLTIDDNLGINQDYPEDSPGPGLPRALGANPWSGYDRQHWLIPYELFAAIAGCDYGVLDLFDSQMVNNWFAQHYIDRFEQGVTPAYEAARAYGRGALHTGCCIYEVTADVNVLAQLRNRLRILHELIPLPPHNNDRRYWSHPSDRRPQYPLQQFPMTRGALIVSGFDSRKLRWEGVLQNFTWEESTVVVGAWACYLLFRELGDSYFENIAKYVSADLANQFVTIGFLRADRSTAEHYRYIFVANGSISSGLGSITRNPGFTNCRGRTVTGGTSGAVGTLVHVLPDDGNVSGLWLVNCNATPFVAAEVVTIDAIGGPITATVSFIQPLMGASALYVSPTDAAFPTQVSLQETFYNAGVDEWDPRNALWYRPYALEQSGVLPIARLLAQQGYYATAHGDRNTEIATAAQAILDVLVAERDAYAGTTWHQLDEFISVIGDPIGGGGEVEPSIPTILPVTNITRNSAIAHWEPTSFNQTSFDIRYGLDEVMWTEVTGIAADATSAGMNGLIPETEYFVQVRAVNAIGASDWSGSQAFTTLADEPPPPPIIGPLTASLFEDFL